VFYLRIAFTTFLQLFKFKIIFMSDEMVSSGLQVDEKPAFLKRTLLLFKISVRLLHDTVEECIKDGLLIVPENRICAEGTVITVRK
jgi:hypothetical protein